MTSFDAGRTLGERFRAHGRALSSSRAPSPLYAELMTCLADDWDAGGVVRRICRGWEDAPPGSVVQLRLLAGLHRVVLRGDAPALAAYYPSAGGDRPPTGVWPVARPVLEAHAAELSDALATAPQTNEPGRSAALLVGVLHAVRQTGLPRVRLLEIGASAGLNLLVDRFRITGDGWASGPADSPVVLADAVRGRLPRPLPDWSVHGRRGCDLEPVDVAVPAGRLQLESFVWPDHVGRFRRLRAALDVAQRVPVPVDRGAASTWLAQQLAAPGDPGVLTVVWHSITRMYWPGSEVAAVDEVVADAGSRLPLARVAMEYGDDGPGAQLTVQVSQGQGLGEPRRLASVADHGVPVRLDPGVALDA
ncbi:MAG TPA: DUF2332 domain-containing protein [Actinomycetales bacterium]|nr:DUF2332 domain-containing protein [Actinomycetales bacterium]